MLIENSIRISAPQSLVWEVTTDVERWPGWTPTVTSVVRVDEGPLRPGSIARIRQPLQSEAEWTVTELVPGESFTWESRRRGLIFKASHSVVADGSDSISRLRLETTGILATLLYPLLRPAAGRALSQENKGLKERCEELSGSGYYH